ncbi:hypothetical protein MTY_0707 [Moorella thermoacetica Y72]|uniref:Uncharacterized protein n=1 Tax=Moorella thermoacetica Y72 TaxID=1325331 RepID=A0A0S6UCL8_NEOTH|nr:hypothetical protein MTY_0707 [Moorella thermoacetica Y72]
MPLPLLLETPQLTLDDFYLQLIGRPAYFPHWYLKAAGNLLGYGAGQLAAVAGRCFFYRRSNGVLVDHDKKPPLK